MLYLLGIDDTDNQGSGGTALLAVKLGKRLEELALAHMVSVSCHQLFRSPEIEFTTENQAACLHLSAAPGRGREVDLVCREFLRRESATGANPGFALAEWNHIDPAIRAWGRTSKAVKMQRQEALELARKHSISIAGFTGSGAGVIGALAAVGLRDDGNDGRFSWLPGLRGLTSGVYRLSELMQIVAFDRVESDRGKKPDVMERINILEGTMPIVRDGKSVLLLQPAKRNAAYGWEVM